MGIFKRKDSPYWQLSYKDANGQRLRTSTELKTEEKGSRKLAEHLLKRKEDDVWKQRHLNAKAPRYWEEAVLEYFKRTKLADKTRSNMQSVFRQLDPYLKGKPLHLITRQFIEGVIEKIEDDYKLKTDGKSYSPTTINIYLNKIKVVLRKAKNDWEWIDTIPYIKLRKELRHEERCATPDEIAILLEKVPPHQRDPILFGLSANGLRKANVARHEKAWIDLEHKVTIVPAKYFKNGKPHAVPLNDIAMEIIKRNWDNPTPYLFLYEGKPFKELNTRAFRNALKEAGIKNFRWHDLRHTWASWAAQNGATLLEIMRGGGWSDFRSVTRYSHLTHDNIRALSDKIADTKLSQIVNREMKKNDKKS